MDKKFRIEEIVQGHFVTLEVSDDRYVIVFVDEWILEVESDRLTRLRIALAARRLWEQALQVLPAGAYYCWPTSQNRKRLYLAAGWKPTPLPLKRGELIFYHRIPPLPEGWMNWMP